MSDGRILPAHIPLGWRRVRLRDVVAFANGMDYTHVEVDEPGYPVYGSGGRFRWASSWLHDGPSVLFGRKGTIDRPLYVDGKFWTVDTMFYTIPNAQVVVPRFLYYWATRIPFDYYSTGTALPSMTQSDLGSEPLILPPIDEQRPIADYLDHETAEIDAFIADLEGAKVLLDRRAVSAIYNVLAPTGGDYRAGESWFSTVPSGWSAERLSWLFGSIGSGTTPRSDDDAAFGGNIPWVTTSELREGEILHTAKSLREGAFEHYSALAIYPRDSVLIAMYGATIGRLGWLGRPAAVNQAVCVFSRPQKEFNARIAYYALWAARDYLRSLADGGGQPNINQEKLRALRIPVPPVEVQAKIVASLDREVEQSKLQLADIDAAIALAKERRAALITAAVTGQIDVTARQKPVVDGIQTAIEEAR